MQLTQSTDCLLRVTLTASTAQRTARHVSTQLRFRACRRPLFTRRTDELYIVIHRSLSLSTQVLLLGWSTSAPQHRQRRLVDAMLGWLSPRQARSAASLVGLNGTLYVGYSRPLSAVTRPTMTVYVMHIPGRQCA